MSKSNKKAVALLGVLILVLAVLYWATSLQVKIGRLEYNLEMLESRIDQLDFYFWYDHEVRIDALEEN